MNALLCRVVWRLTWLVAGLSGIAPAQNLVPNGGFEAFRACPRLQNSLEEATPWYNPNTTTPDFFHTCSGLFQANQSARSGQGFAGLFYSDGAAEYLGVPLTEALVAGECYFFEMYVSVESPGKYLTRTLGAYFSKTPLTAPANGLLNADPQVLDGLNTITQPFRWERVAGFVKASGGEKYLTIGYYGQLPPRLGYHDVFIDDVSLVKVKVDLGRDTTLCSRQNTLRLDATTPGATEYRWHDGSTAPTRLVTQPGTYAVTVTTPCKVLRDTIAVRYSLDFDLGRDTTLCTGQTLALRVPTLAGASYRWQDGSARADFTVRQAGRYGVVVTQQSCVVRDSLRVRYVAPPRLDLGLDRDLCRENPVVLHPTFADGRFAWDDGAPDPVREVANSGVYRATVRSECATLRDSVVVRRASCPCTFYTPDVFTPNADGLNDDFAPVESCGEIRLTSLTIFDRWGEVLFRADAPPFRWDGRLGNQLLPNGVYAWKIGFELRTEGRQRTEWRQGAVTLAR